MTLLTIHEASRWASEHLREQVSPSNISYLIQYGKVHRHLADGATRIALEELQSYYQSSKVDREGRWKKVLGDDLHWHLSFDRLRERDTTKHVHRLHPYKGKFIPQLVEYFLDRRTDDIKTTACFQAGDIVLDPFLGSGTTLVQAHEMGIHGIGIDVSRFNCVIAKCKTQPYDLAALRAAVAELKTAVRTMEHTTQVPAFEEKLLQAMSAFNAEHFPNPSFRYQVAKKELDEAAYATEREAAFLPVYRKLVKRYGIAIRPRGKQSFLDAWYVENVRQEIDAVSALIRRQPDDALREILSVILSRTVRSCRATTHSDLATLKTPQLTPYYCFKHKKICKPLFSIRKMLFRYADDTLQRLEQFSALRTDARSCAIAGDSRTAHIARELRKQEPALHDLYAQKKIRGIFSSPPYVGQIDYHEQHAYAYDLFGFDRNDALEIGPLYKGQGSEARASYVEGIAAVLKNCKRFLDTDYDVFLVANDKWNLYPTIAEQAGMQIVRQYKRPVLNRTERDRNPYAETIFHLKQK